MQKRREQVDYYIDIIISNKSSISSQKDPFPPPPPPTHTDNIDINVLIFFFSLASLQSAHLHARWRRQRTDLLQAQQSILASGCNRTISYPGRRTPVHRKSWLLPLPSFSLQSQFPCRLRVVCRTKS